MNSPEAFSQADHPLIIIFQIIYDIGLFVLFLMVRKRPNPMPQLVAVTAFAVLINLGARVTRAFWFAPTDVIAWGSICMLSTVWLFSVVRQKIAAMTGAGDETGQSAMLTSDLFDQKDRRNLWRIGLTMMGLLLYSYLNTYSEKVQAGLDAVTAYARGYTQAVHEQKKTDKQDKAERDSMARVLREKTIKDSLFLAFIARSVAANGAEISKVNKTIQKKKSPVVVIQNRSVGLPIYPAPMKPTPPTGIIPLNRVSPVPQQDPPPAPKPRTVRQGKYGYIDADTSDTITAKATNAVSRLNLRNPLPVNRDSLQQ